MAAISTEEEARIKAKKRVTDLKATEKDLEDNDDVLSGVIYEVIEAADRRRSTSR